MFAPVDGLFQALGRLIVDVLLLGVVSTFGGLAVAFGLRLRGLRWTWSAALLGPVVLLGWWSPLVVFAGAGVCMVGCLAGMALHSGDVMAGADRAQLARARLGVLEALGRALEGWRDAREGAGWVREGHLEVGLGEHGRRVSIRAGGSSGSHTLILGATGSGKTCGQAWIAGRLIEGGHAAIAIDPKGDGVLREELQAAARRAGVPFLEWTPAGPCSYNPYASGSATQTAEKALLAEAFTEPHYLRQAQRYLAHAVRAMRAAGVDVSPASLALHMDPLRLEQLSRTLAERDAARAQEYLDSLSERQRRELAGVRDRLSILPESDVGRWLEPDGGEATIALGEAVRERAVVYFSLQSDSRPLLAAMLGGALVVDLLMLAAERQHDRGAVPVVALIDEFAAIGAAHVAKLFGRARSAGISLVLIAQEIADLEAVAGRPLRDQAGGNLGALIAYRQNMPDSAELIARMAATEPGWSTSQHVRFGLLGPRPSVLGTRTREHQPVIHPSHIMRLADGEAVVITPGSGQPPQIARMHHPSIAQRNAFDL